MLQLQTMFHEHTKTRQIKMETNNEIIYNWSVTYTKYQQEVLLETLVGTVVFKNIFVYNFIKYR